MKAEWTNKDVLTQSETTGQSKSILVFDMPTTCTDCPCYDYIHGVCANTHKDCELRIQEKPSWCPLKQMPPKKEIDIETDLSSISGNDYISGYKDGYNRGVDVGWNRCLDEILGETE